MQQKFDENANKSVLKSKLYPDGIVYPYAVGGDVTVVGENFYP